MSRIFLKRSLIESLIGAELPISNFPGPSTILEDSNNKLVLFNEKLGKFFDITDDLSLEVRHIPIKKFFDTYIEPGTVLKLIKIEKGGNVINFLINFIEIFGDNEDSPNVSLWAKGDYLRLETYKENSYWDFTIDSTRERVLFSFTLFPNTWWIDLPNEEERKIFSDKLKREEN